MPNPFTIKRNNQRSFTNRRLRMFCQQGKPTSIVPEFRIMNVKAKNHQQRVTKNHVRRSQIQVSTSMDGEMCGEWEQFKINFCIVYFQIKKEKEISICISLKLINKSSKYPYYIRKLIIFYST